MVIKNNVTELKKYFLTTIISEDISEDVTRILKHIVDAYPEILNLNDFRSIFTNRWYVAGLEYHDTMVNINAPTFFCIDSNNQFFILVSMTKEMLTLTDNFTRYMKILLLLSEKIKELSNIKFEYVVIDTKVDGFACISHGLPLRYLTGAETYH